MSIIHDALKKVQNNITKSPSPDKSSGNLQNPRTGQTGPAYPRPETATSNEPPRPNSVSQSLINNKDVPSSNKKNKTPLLVTALLCLVLVGALLFFLQKQQSQQVSISPPISIPLKLPFPQKKTPTAIPSQLVINGIVSSDGRNLALINNNIYEAGETIGDIKIVEITPDSIKILDNGEIKTLKVQFKD